LREKYTRGKKEILTSEKAACAKNKRCRLTGYPDRLDAKKKTRVSPARRNFRQRNDLWARIDL